MYSSSESFSVWINEIVGKSCPTSKLSDSEQNLLNELVKQ